MGFFPPSSIYNGKLINCFCNDGNLLIYFKTDKDAAAEQFFSEKKGAELWWEGHAKFLKLPTIA